MNNKERYEDFLNHSSWKGRFTWKGLYGNSAYVPISLHNYNNATKALTVLKFSNTLSFFKEMKSASIDYSNWCKSKMNLTQDEVLDLQKFFIGCIGEFFFFKLFEEKKQIIISYKKKAYTFYNICPRSEKDYDFGIDLTGTVSVLDKTYDCALQVKFWSPFVHESFMTYEILAKAYTDAVANKMINIEDSENIFVCWLGNTETDSSRWIEKSPIYKNIVFIDRTVLSQNVDGDKMFWENINKDISNI